MPNLIDIAEPGDGFAGVRSLMQYVNDDGLDPRNVCGQAACATLLTYCELLPPSLDSLRQIEKSHPADILGGAWGTSPWRIDATLRDYGMPDTTPINTLEDLKESIADLNPVICVIQNDPGWYGLRHGAHWFVVHAFNDVGVYVTNYGDNFLAWGRFADLWASTVSRIARIKFKGVTCTTRAIPTPIPAALVP